MNPNKLKRLFPHASEAFTRLNSDNSNDTGMSNKSESLDRKEVCKTRPSEEVGEVDRKCFVQIEFFAEHGQALDEDNRRFIAKPFLDALVNLGFSKTDKDFKSEVYQRFNKDHINI